jgi:hypothetical protein
MKLIWKSKKAEVIDLDALMMNSIEEQLQKEKAEHELTAGNEVVVDDDNSSLGVNADGDFCWKRPAA